MITIREAVARYHIPDATLRSQLQRHTDAWGAKLVGTAGRGIWTFDEQSPAFVAYASTYEPNKPGRKKQQQQGEQQINHVYEPILMREALWDRICRDAQKHNVSPDSEIVSILEVWYQRTVPDEKLFIPVIHNAPIGEMGEPIEKEGE